MNNLITPAVRKERMAQAKNAKQKKKKKKDFVVLFILYLITKKQLKRPQRY
jgi:hypothetical protein